MSAFWEVQKLGFQLASAVVKGTVKGAARAGTYSVDQARKGRARAQAAGGVLAPGDSPAPPGYDVLDYRGLALPSSLRLATTGLPLGRPVDLRRGPGAPAALPIGELLTHACVIGPSGSGKTYSIVVPWTVALLAAGCSVVTIDVKGDLLQEIQRHLVELGQPSGAKGFVWDYAGASGHRWNFLQEITTDKGIDAAAVSLVGRAKPNDAQPFFYQRDYRWMKGLVRLVVERLGPAAEPRHLLQLLQDQDRLDRWASTSSAASELADLCSAHPNDFGKDVSGLLNALSLFREPAVVRATSTSDFTLRQVVAEPSLLVAVAKLSDGRRAEQMSSLLLSQFTQSVLDRFGGRRQRPVVFMVDEAPRLTERIDLEQMLSVARGANAGVCLAAQDVGQFGTEQEQSSLLANCHTYVSMFGVSPASAEYLSKRLGNRMKEESTVTINGSRKLFEPPGRSRQATVGPVLGSREIMFSPLGQRTALVHCPSVSVAPFMVDVERR